MRAEGVVRAERAGTWTARARRRVRGAPRRGVGREERRAWIVVRRRGLVAMAVVFERFSLGWLEACIQGVRWRSRRCCMRQVKFADEEVEPQSHWPSGSGVAVSFASMTRSLPRGSGTQSRMRQYGIA